jgi:hypothetical protein
MASLLNTFDKDGRTVLDPRTVALTRCLALLQSVSVYIATTHLLDAADDFDLAAESEACSNLFADVTQYGARLADDLPVLCKALNITLTVTPMPAGNGLVH